MAIPLEELVKTSHIHDLRIVDKEMEEETQESDRISSICFDCRRHIAVQRSNQAISPPCKVHHFRELTSPAPTGKTSEESRTFECSLCSLRIAITEKPPYITPEMAKSLTHKMTLRRNVQEVLQSLSNKPEDKIYRYATMYPAHTLRLLIDFLNGNRTFCKSLEVRCFLGLESSLQLLRVAGFQVRCEFQQPNIY